MQNKICALQYTMDVGTGSFTHRNADSYEREKHLRTITYASGSMTYEETDIKGQAPTLEVRWHFLYNIILHFNFLNDRKCWRKLSSPSRCHLKNPPCVHSQRGWRRWGGSSYPTRLGSTHMAVHTLSPTPPSHLRAIAHTPWAGRRELDTGSGIKWPTQRHAQR